MAWGKTTTRKLRTKSGKRVRLRRRCGEWCRWCHNVARIWVKNKKYLKQHAGKKGRALDNLKKDLRDKPELLQSFQEQ
eukprot:12038387-Alexandrium_andersonii.AAC.1